MSLLLDALKKAAEQKAAKNKSEAPEGSSSGETLLDDGSEDITELMKGADDGLRQSLSSVRDETELDDAEFETRVEHTRDEPQDRTDTRLETPDATETEIPPASSQMETGEDETIIFAEDDVADFTGDPAMVNREERAPDDETDLSRLSAREDETDLNQPIEARETRPQPADEDETQLRAPGSAEDQTDLSQPLRAQETPRQRAAEDETQLGDPGKAEDQTDISIPPASVADLEHAEAQRTAASDETDISEIVEPAEDADDEDMSLLLVERDQTNLTIPPPASDTRRPGEQVEGLSEESIVDDELGLVDTTRHRLPPEEPQEADETQSSATATTGIALDTQTTRRSATTPTESTSTRTYAPDNYDRTLMRLPSDDASKMFAGMKSDSDVVMTPEYAKKVFDSKSSEQRLQHYKFYSGIALVILLAISVYGLFEYQDQSSNIDDSLRALKRDPMPGVISSGSERQGTSLFPESKVDERTIGIIENADSAADDPVAAAVVVAEEAASEEADDGAVAQVEPGVTSETAVGAEMAAEQETGLAMAEAPADSAVTEFPRVADEANATVEVAIATPTETGAAATGSSGASSTLEISSTRQVAQKDTWLREAYAAYQAGNDELALELYNKVLKQHPRNRNALLARAAIHVQNNNGIAAIQDYQTILLDNPKDSLAMASLITVANYSPQESETQLKLMVREAPDSPYLNFALANAYSAQNRWQEAQGYYFRALQNNPGDPNYAYNLAVSLEHISQPRAAMSYYQRALENFDNGLATFSREVVDQRLEMLAKL